ncbi:hypothetical protein G5C60_47665 [Streptomyces sp. HC44]|uniref:Sel1 repeat family protein n=1 Tax=Streptomyces scabichelini TaxID=2711217 RepID=A0A6G4VMR9_9ACTN|nr:hypothetical protein [Streptomyces scabichelini]NGO15067.1 hypothetical protein [Streptomyces scabichelini]
MIELGALLQRSGDTEGTRTWLRRAAYDGQPSAEELLTRPADLEDR